MDELTRYLFNHYSDLMTPQERAAWKSLIAEEKAQASEAPKTAAALRRHFVSDDPQVQELLRDGAVSFQARVRDRLLTECADDIFLNHCPRCGALAKTPRARQCPRCFHDWHESG